ncbi:MAG: hypothetical protein HY717_05085 [Planctomycetes bacterium]|nr:hypothetical protein [Planctomycetota bacterium]
MPERMKKPRTPMWPARLFLSGLFDPDRWRSIFLILRRLAVAALLIAATWGSLEIKRRVENDRRFQLTHMNLSIRSYPDWVTPEIQMEIESSQHLGKAAGAEEPQGEDQALSIFRKKALAELRGDLLASAWIRSVPRLSFRYPSWPQDPAAPAGGLDADLELRRPIAAVKWGEHYYLVDAEAVRLGAGLPAAAFERSFDRLRAPAIIGLEKAIPGPPAPPERGEVWQTREVLEGLSVAWELFKAGINWRFPQEPVQSINIQNVSGKIYPLECEVVLKTPNFLLGWGRSPVSLGARLLPVKQVLENLEKVLSLPEKYAGGGLIRLDTAPLVRVTHFKDPF